MVEFVSGYEHLFLGNLLFSLLAGFLIGIERRTSGKPAGVATHCFVIAGAMIFTMLSYIMSPDEPARIAAQIVTGVGFLGAGVIMQKDGAVTNLTTAASIWMSAAIGIAIGFHMYLLAILATIYAVVVPKLSWYVKNHLEPEMTPYMVPKKRK